MKLSEDKIKYSPSEVRVFDILAKTKEPATSEDVADKMYAKGKAPYHAVRVAMMTLKSLAQKIHENKEPFVLKQSARKGPYPVHFWLERRK